MTRLLHVLQFSDSAFPVGTFSFSNGLETASYEGIVKDAATLEEFTRSVVLQAAFSDGVAAILAHRAIAEGDYEGLVNVDRTIMLFKMNAESRMMLQRMGKKLAELAGRLFPESETIKRWLADINAGVTPGSYPVAQAIAFSEAGLDERQLYTSHQFGVANMIVSAALRCVRVSHYDTQIILMRLSDEIDAHYSAASAMTLDDMNSFVPEIDIFASLHEKGKMRMFMN